jgi:hypothetical protein
MAGAASLNVGRLSMPPFSRARCGALMWPPWWRATCSIISGEPLWSCCVVRVVKWRLVSVACEFVVLVVFTMLVGAVVPSLFFLNTKRARHDLKKR